MPASRPTSVSRLGIAVAVASRARNGTACGVAEYSVPWWMMLLNRCSAASSASSSSSPTASRSVWGKSSAEPYA